MILLDAGAGAAPDAARTPRASARQELQALAGRRVAAGALLPSHPRTVPARIALTVTIGHSAGGLVEVLSGLRAGEDVVVDGVFTLKSVILKSQFAEEE